MQVWMQASLEAIVPAEFEGLERDPARVLQEAWRVWLDSIVGQQVVRIASDDVGYDGHGALPARVVVRQDDNV